MPQPYAIAAFPTDEEMTILRAAFKAVENPKDWRAPINATVDLAQPGSPTIGAIREAVEWFTATVARVTHVHGALIRVQAIGYRAGPAGP